MEFHILGPVEALDEGRPLPIGGPRQRALLALLLLHANEVVSSEHLIDELWAAKQPKDPHTALQNQVSRLRKALGGRIVGRSRGYIIQLERGELDLDRFQTHVAEAEELEARDRSERLSAALALWHGRPLSNVAHEPFAELEASRLEELRLAALEERIDADLELGHHADLVGELQALVGEHPLRERLRGQLMLALHRCGRQAEALDVFRQGRRSLVEELGLEPSAELKELEAAILRQDPALIVPPSRRASKRVVPPQHRWRRRGVLAAVALTTLLVPTIVLAILSDGEEPTLAPAETIPKAASKAAKRVARTTTTARAERPQKTRQPPSRRTASPVALSPPIIGPSAPLGQKKAAVKTRRKAESRREAERARTTPEAPAPPPLSPEPPADAREFKDDFEDGVFGPVGEWRVLVSGRNIDMNERNGRLEISFAADAQASGQFFNAHYGPPCRFPGDFDARVDFDLVQWPRSNGVSIDLSAYFTPAGGSLGDVWSRFERSSPRQTAEAYRSWIPPSSRIIDTSDTRGRLRLARVAGVVNTYFFAGGEWVKVDSGTLEGTVLVSLQMFSTNQDFGGAAVRVAFDNLSIVADRAVC